MKPGRAIAPGEKPAPGGHVDSVTRYASAALAGKIIVGPYVRQACARHLRDLERDDIEWHPELVERVIAYYRYRLCLAAGEFEGMPFILEPFQEFIAGSLMGWLRKDGARRYRTAYIEAGKGAGKSPFGGGMALYLGTADNEPRAECYFAAQKKDQAAIAFRTVLAMVDRSPHLSARLKKSGLNPAWNLFDPSTGSFLRPISSEKKGQSGPLPHFALLDEVHEIDDPTVLNMMRKGVKNRRQPLIMEITNSGVDRNSICFQHHEYSRAILDGTKENDEWFAYVCALDPEDFPTDPQSDPMEHLLAHPEVWVKTNPGIGKIATEDYIRKELVEAIGMPAQRNLTLRLNFCVWTESNTVWIPSEIWDACGGVVDEAALRGRTAYGGLDLSATTDMTAAVLYFPPLNGEPAPVLCRFWLPKADLHARIRRDGLPYAQWAHEGLLTLTDGDVVDYATVRTGILDLTKSYNVKEWAYDPWNAMETVTALAGQGLTMVEARQGTKTLSAPMKDLTVKIRRKEINHGGHPILRANVAATSVRMDDNENIKPDKAESTGRIDGVVALIDAIWRATLVRGPVVSVYETRGIRALGGGEDDDD